MNILVLREPTFVVVTNPVQKYHPIQMNFLGEKLNFKIFLGFLQFFWDHQIKGIDFTLGDGNTEVYFACSLVFKGETLILGGKRNYNQVSFRWQWCWWLNDGETLRCWWQLCWWLFSLLLISSINEMGHQHSNSVTKIQKLSPTQMVSNISLSPSM